MFCIPQDPFLFGGTIRENLDPLGEFRENEMWNALTKVNLVDVIKRLGGLDHSVDGSGDNFSSGQKQLICLARAVLHNAKVGTSKSSVSFTTLFFLLSLLYKYSIVFQVLCIDEATANVDEDTDQLIQRTLRTAFRKSTVITIAHRIRTIFDSDRVLVMENGEIIEFDTPDNLLYNTDSKFYNLVHNES